MITLNQLQIATLRYTSMAERIGDANCFHCKDLLPINLLPEINLQTVA